MTIHVNIGEAKTRLSELIAAAVRGEDVVLAKAGEPQVRLVPFDGASAERRQRIADKRSAAIGMWADAFEGFDTSIDALKAGRGDPEERFRRKFGLPD
jgi:prevent-host-death family protein